ncbi:MAG: hypothetical protein WCT22_01680 [Patescibacteria group bacterium]|jgi:hypothetical protein
MKKNGLIKIIFYLLFTILFLCPPVQAFQISSDPQYIVINFSDTFHFLNWSAPEKEWRETIKPKAKARLRNIKMLLTIGATKDRQLAWSTLLEYMNYPLDVPSDNSPYVVRVRRIMELAEEENFPVFIPLNGVQWWDELPELWNWWDYDGNQIPGCTNTDYEKCPFKKLRDPEYRSRFIKGFNPDNKWNVDWQDWTTPMKFGIRNWGSGDIYVAPSPNLAGQTNVSPSFVSMQKKRYEKIIKTISNKLNLWEKEGRDNLFAGLSIGTEVTLNGALKPGDNEFKPYGYRAIQDVYCPLKDKECGQNKNWTYDEIIKMREGVIKKYFEEFTFIANRNGIPKQRLYTHVWSEAGPRELRYMDAIGSSVSPFSRPGMSIYGKALNPLGFPLLLSTLEKNGYIPWAAPEFAPLDRDAYSWNTALSNTLNNTIDPAKLIDVYNEADILNTPAIPALKNILNQEPIKAECNVSEINPLTKRYETNPEKFEWKNLNNDNAVNQSIIIWGKNSFPKRDNLTTKEYPISSMSSNIFQIPPLERGFYYWAVKRTGCGNKWTMSTPQVMYIFPALPEVKIPFWVKWILDFKK